MAGAPGAALAFPRQQAAQPMQQMMEASACCVSLSRQWAPMRCIGADGFAMAADSSTTWYAAECICTATRPIQQHSSLTSSLMCQHGLPLMCVAPVLRTTGTDVICPAGQLRCAGTTGATGSASGTLRTPTGCLASMACCQKWAPREGVWGTMRGSCGLQVGQLAGVAPLQQRLQHLICILCARGRST